LNGEQMEKISLKKIAVMGGSRFIGFHLLHALHKQGHDITVFNRSLSIPPAPFPKDITFVKGDRNRPEDIKKLFNKKYDVLIDLYGWKSGHVKPIIQNYRSNIGHYIYLSTTGVYKRPLLGPMDEESPRMLTENTSSGNKALTEELLLKAHKENYFPVTIFRAHGVVGPYDPCSIGLIFYRLIHSLPLYVDSQADTNINYLYVDDLIQAFRVAMNNPKAFGSVYGVAGDDITTPRELIELCGKICSKSPELKFVDNPAAYENAKYIKEKRFVKFCIPWPEYDEVCDNHKIKRELGVQFTDLKTNISKIYSWLLEKPSYLGYFSLRGEQYILRSRPIPLMVKLCWNLTDVFGEVMKRIKKLFNTIDQNGAVHSLTISNRLYSTPFFFAFG